MFRGDVNVTHRIIPEVNEPTLQHASSVECDERSHESRDPKMISLIIHLFSNFYSLLNFLKKKKKGKRQ